MALKLSVGKRKSSSVSAGLAIRDNYLYFVEIDENNQPVNKVMVELDEGCTVNGSIKDSKLLEEGFKRIYKQAGRVKGPVNIGLPGNDALIRSLDFPKMSLQDIKGTLDLDFEEKFPYSRLDAVFDIAGIQTPADLHERDEVTVLAAAAKRQVVDSVLNAAKEAGFTAGAIEPSIFAMLRAVPDVQEGLCVFADAHNTITLWEGNGIAFRSTNNTSSIQGLLDTMGQISIKYRNINVNAIVVSDIKLEIGDETTIKIVHMDDPYFAAQGLAMRGHYGTSVLDLRPSEYIELERRRYSFNPNRLALWGLLSGFLMTAIGTVSFAFFAMRDLSESLELMRQDVNGLTLQRIALTEENRKLEAQRKKTEKVLEFLKNDIPALEIMNALEANAGTGIKFGTATFTRGITGCSVVIDGRAYDEKSVLSLTEGLKGSGLFSSVMLPVSQKDQLGRIQFNIVLRVRDLI